MLLGLSVELVPDSVLLGGVELTNRLGGVVLTAEGDAVSVEVGDGLAGFDGWVGCGRLVDEPDELLDDGGPDDVGLEG